MLKPLEFHRLAIQEARKAFRWYAGRSPEAAIQFRQRFKEALEKIESYPQRWPHYLFGTQVVPLRRFPYLIVYRDTPTCAAIVAVVHGHRRPGYWRRRKL